MRTGLIAAVALVLILSFMGDTGAHHSSHQKPPRGPHMMGEGYMGGPGMMGPGMKGPMGGGMMGPMMRIPEVMGTMMSIHGEVMTLMGEMIQKYGVEQMTPEHRQRMKREVLERMGEILSRRGRALKESAKAVGK